MATSLKSSFFLLAFLSSSLLVTGQKTLQQTDRELTDAYNKIDNPDGDYHKKLRSFEKRFALELKKPASFSGSFDSLAKLIVIRTSSDKKIKFYSWDDKGGGSRYDIYCFAQFMGTNGEPVVQKISKNEGIEQTTSDFSNSNIYQVNELMIGKEKYYLTLGWGSYGGGNEFHYIRLLRIHRNKVLSCDSCFSNRDNQVIEHPRSMADELRFDRSSGEISFLEFLWDNNVDIYRKTGKRIILKLLDGKFIRQN